MEQSRGDAGTLQACIIYKPPWSKRAGRLGVLLTPICLRDFRDCAPLSMPLVLITRRENFAVHTDNQIQMTLQHLTLPIQRLQLTIPEEIIHSRGEELNFSNHAFSIGLDSKRIVRQLGSSRIHKICRISNRGIQ